jgi:hypothetical protein
MMSGVFLSLLCGLTLALAGCKKPASRAASESLSVAASSSPAQSVPVTATTKQQPQDEFDACTLITKEEIAAIQGSPVKETKSSGTSSEGLRTSQCFYNAEEFSKSVSLTVTKSDSSAPAKSSPRDFWGRTFGQLSDGPHATHDDKDKNAAGGKEEEKESARAKKVEGVGEDAYWTGNRVGGTLYVLKDDTFLRISLGGKDDEETRINKSKALVEKALPRL